MIIYSEKWFVKESRMNQKEKNKLLNWIRWRSFRVDGWVRSVVDTKNLKEFIPKLYMSIMDFGMVLMMDGKG